MPANMPPDILELIVRLSARRLSQMAILRNRGVPQGGISKVLRRVWETGRAIQRPHGHRLRMTTPRGDRALIQIMRRNRFSLIIENKSKADQANWALCLCPHGPETFGSSCVSLETSSPIPHTDSWSSQLMRRMGIQGPELETSALVSCDVCWWVEV